MEPKSDDPDCKQPESVAIQCWDLTLRIQGSGRAIPWLGRALRGLVAMQLKEAVCRFDPREREYCKGCPHIADCEYGRLFEPDPPPNYQPMRGQEEIVRPLVMAPAFPAPAYFMSGQPLAVRLTVLGKSNGRAVPELIENLRKAGSARGLGEDQVPFEVELLSPEPEVEQLRLASLPVSPEIEPGRSKRLRIELESPLFLRSELRRKRQDFAAPSFQDLFRSALRILGIVFRTEGWTTNQIDFRGLKQAAGEVTAATHRFEHFSQHIHSNRGRQRFLVAGTIGSGEFLEVPASLIPWMEWAGRLHVGVHRIAGAGGWQISQLD